MKEFTLIFALVAIVFSCQKKETIVLDKGFCKLVKRGVFTGDYPSPSTTSFSWDGNIQTGDDGTVTEYNSFGSVIRHVDASGFTSLYEYEDCRRFCRLTRLLEISVLGDHREIVYTWRGNTRTGADGTVAAYNNHGDMLSFEWHNRKSRWEYMEGDDFCRMVKYTTEGSHETIQVTYSWEGNTRISEYGEVVEHNDFGKVLRISHAGGNGGVLAYEYAGCE